MSVKINRFIERLQKKTEDEVIVGKKIRCINPEHEDKEPSMHIYENHAYCFGCKYRFPKRRKNIVVSDGIPKQLQKEDFKFILLKAKEKIPFEKDWQNTANYQYNDPKLLDHLKNSGNYGVLGGCGNLLILDFDSPELEEKYIPELPETFTIKTGSGGKHLYYFCENTRSFKFKKIDVQGTGKQVVGAGSVHPNGKRYIITKDIPISTIERSFLEKIFKKGKEGEVFTSKQKENSQLKFRFLDVVIAREGDQKGLPVGYKVNIDRLSNYLSNEKFTLKTIYGRKEETIFYYDNGIWLPTGQGLVEAEIERVLDEHAKNNVVREIVGKVKRITATKREDFEVVPENLVPFENGVLKIDNGKYEFIVHDKHYNFKSKLPINYNPNAKCPKILKFLNESTCQENILQIQEWLGFLLTRGYKHKKAVLIWGERNTGKTVFLVLLKHFLGQENISNLSLQQIASGKSFDLLSLKDKFANFYDDLSSVDLKSSGGFKMAVGQGFISGEIKFGDRITFPNTAKLMFTCNQIPSIKDINDEAYYDRWLLWSFDNVVLKKDRDKDLINKLTSKDELSGLLNWSLIGLTRLTEQNQFSNELEADEVKKLMQNSNSPLSTFCDNFEYSQGEKITKEEMYQYYIAFCNENNLTPRSKDYIGKNIQRFAPYIKTTIQKSIRYWYNIRVIHLFKNYEALFENREKSNNHNNDNNNIYDFEKAVLPVCNGKIVLQKTTPEFWKCDGCKKNIQIEFIGSDGKRYCRECSTDEVCFETRK